MSQTKIDLTVTKTLPDSSEITCYFKKPNKLTYKLAMEYLQSEDRFSAFETIFNSTLHSTDYEGGIEAIKNDETLKTLFFGDLAEKYLNFSDITVDVEKTESNFIVKINNKSVTLRYPNKEEYKEIFNRNVKNYLDAWEYIYDNLKTEGNDINDLKLFAAASNVPSLIIYNKQISLKKK